MNADSSAASHCGASRLVASTDLLLHVISPREDIIFLLSCQALELYRLMNDVKLLSTPELWQKLSSCLTAVGDQEGAAAVYQQVATGEEASQQERTVRSCFIGLLYGTFQLMLIGAVWCSCHLQYSCLLYGQLKGQTYIAGHALQCNAPFECYSPVIGSHANTQDLPALPYGRHPPFLFLQSAGSKTLQQTPSFLP